MSGECRFPANVRICFVRVWPHSDTLTWRSCITLNSAGLHTFAAFTAEWCVSCVVNLCKCSLISSRWERPLSSWCLPGCYCYGKTSPSSPNHSRHPLHCSAASLVNIRKCFSGCVCWWFSVTISVRVRFCWVKSLGRRRAQWVSLCYLMTYRSSVVNNEGDGHSAIL